MGAGESKGCKRDNSTKKRNKVKKSKDFLPMARPIKAKTNTLRGATDANLVLKFME